MAAEKVQPVPCVFFVRIRGARSALNFFPSKNRSTAGPFRWPPLIITAGAPISTIFRAACSNLLAAAKLHARELCGFGNIWRDQRRQRNQFGAQVPRRAFFSISKSPEVATITGSTTRFLNRCRRMVFATMPIIAALASMPVFTAWAPMSAMIASIWLRRALG